LNYRNGEYLRVAYTCTTHDDGVDVRIGPRKGRFLPWWSQIELVVFNAQPDWKAMWNGKRIPATFDKAAHALHVVIPEEANGNTVLFTAK
jgi:alpha-glucosidase